MVQIKKILKKSEWKKVCQANTIQMKVGVKKKKKDMKVKITWDNMGYHDTIKSSIHQDNIWVLNIYTVNNNLKT